jgi:WD40 repeat protein
MTADGSRVAFIHQFRGLIYVYPPEAPELYRTLGPVREPLSSAVISPDGLWVVGSCWPTPRAYIWDALTREKVKDVDHLTRSASFAFSPDGRRLAFGGPPGGEVWEVGTWGKPSRKIPPDANGPWVGCPCYSPDGRLLAVTRAAAREIQLLDADTLREVARLEAPDPQAVTVMAFSRDGSRLATACGTRVVQVWDLRRIRARLAELGLDWDHPPLPDAEPPPAPLRVEVIKR